MKSHYSVGSMFAGIGGICLAFKNAGYKIKWANEIDKNACITYRENFPEHKLIEGDVREVDDPKKIGYVDIITSGFPCQAFSVAGYRKGFNDPRGNLFFETARFIDAIRPKAYLLENVKNLKGHDKGRTLKIIEQTITRELGYSFYPFILNSKDYDVPQTRERIYIVGFRGEADFKRIKNEENNFSYNSNKENIYTFNFSIPESVKSTKTIHDVLLKDRQPAKYYYKENHQYYPILAKEVKSEDTLYQWRRVYVRENKNGLCPTLTANMGTGGHNVPLIKNSHGIRKLTPRECLRFQGFPDSFKIPKEMANSHLYKQIGNSVAVPVVQRIAENIKLALGRVNEFL